MEGSFWRRKKDKGKRRIELWFKIKMDEMDKERKIRRMEKCEIWKEWKWNRRERSEDRNKLEDLCREIKGYRRYRKGWKVKLWRKKVRGKEDIKIRRMRNDEGIIRRNGRCSEVGNKLRNRKVELLWRKWKEEKN